MIVFDSALIMKRIEDSGHSTRKLAGLTKEIDPDGKGISHMTILRLINGADPGIVTITLLCAALKISPRSLWKDDGKIKSSTMMTITINSDEDQDKDV